MVEKVEEFFIKEKGERMGCFKKLLLLCLLFLLLVVVFDLLLSEVGDIAGKGREGEGEK